MGVNPDILAYGKVVIEVAENIQRDMAKVEAEVERGLKRLDRKEAELKITADDRSFVNKLRKAQKDAVEASEAREKALTDVEKRSANARYANAKGRLKGLENANVKLYNKLVKLDEDRAALHEKLGRQQAAGERKLTKAIETENDKRAKAEQQRVKASNKANTKIVNDRIAAAVKIAVNEDKIEKKRISDSNKLQSRALNDRIRLAVKAANDTEKIEQRSHAALNRQRQQAYKQQAADMENAAELHARYINLMEKRQAIAIKRSKLFTTSNDRIRLDVDMRRIDKQAAEVRARLEAIDEPPVDIDLELDDRGSKALSKWAHLISDTSVRLGPFTTSIGGATRVLALFGPVITGVAGALGALAGVLGSGAFGALGTLTAGTLGFGAALGGVGLLMPKLMGDFKRLNSLQDAYTLSVLKYGKAAPPTLNKLEQFNHALGAVPETTLATFQALDRLSKQWGKLSKMAAPTFYEDVAAFAQMANKNIGMFGDETLESFEIVSDGWKSLMQGLQSDEAITNFTTLSDNAQASLPAFGRGLASVGRAIVNIGVNFSRYLPSLGDGFERWADGLEAVTDDTDSLNGMVDQSVSSMRSLGKLTQSTLNFLTAFFGRGVEPGIGLLDRMSAGLDKWTASIRANPEGLDSFFGGSVETTEDLWEAIVPLAKLFMEWATIMRPFTTGMLAATEAISGIVEGIASFGPIRNFITVAFGVFLAGSLAGKIMGVVGAMRALAASVTAVGTANAGARIGDMFTGGGLGLAARQQRKAGTKGGAATAPRAGTPGMTSGPLVAGMNSPAAKKAGAGAVRSFFSASIKGAGLLGLGVMASDILMKGVATAGVRAGGESTIRGIGQDIMGTLSLGMVDGASEASGKAGKAAVEALRRNMNDSLKGKLVDGGIFKSVYGEDLTGEQRKFLDRFKSSLQAAASIARDFNMPTMRADVKVDSDPRDFATLRKNFSRLKNGLVSNVREMRSISDQNIRAIAKTLGTESNAGKRAVIENMDLTARSIGRSMKNGSTSARDGMRAIRETFKSNSRAAKETTGTNFELAKKAIQQAVRNSVISSKRGTREIKRLWVENLQMYGLSPRQAKNIAETGDPDANKGREGGHLRARGGLVNVGTPGKRAHDNIPAMLNGQPSIVAEGEQVAVFNRHQQKAMNAMLPGGLPGFFGKNKKPHYAAQGGLFPSYAGGGIVPVPGFPGESAAASVIEMITMIAKRFALTLTDAFGGGHKSPGHTVTGTAADFSGPDANMDAAVRFLVSKGFLVGYDGRFGSQDWPDHGPSTRTSNYHLHVELGGSGGMAPLEPPNIPRQKLGLPGAIGGAAQAMVDSARGAANYNLEQVASNFFAPIAGGAGGAKPGAGAASRSQMEAWAAQALTITGAGASPGNIAKILSLAMKESSWVVDSINNWDVNAKAGNPSGGLMHVTLDKVGGSMARLFDPVQNMVASIRYQLERYGKLITFSPYAKGGLVEKFKTMIGGKGGGTVRQPTLMMGEESPREYVISTNPAYKKANQARLGQAAAALGVPQAAKGYTPSTKPPPKHPDNVPKYKRKGKNRAKRAKRGKKLGRKWNDYIDNLQDRKEDLTREVSYREGLVEEPSDLMVESGRIIQKDPETGEDVDYGPRMVVNEDAINKYKEQINFVLQAFNPLRGVTQSLYRDIPKAMENFRNERRYRKDTIERLKDAINRDEGRVGNKKLSDEARKNARERLKDNNKRLNDERAIIDDIDSDLGSLGDDRKDAGFDIREYNDDISQWKEDRDTISGKATSQADKENAEEVKNGPDTSGDSSSGSTSPTMQMQTMSADTERANILREFGGNVNQAVAGIGGSASGLQANLASSVVAGITAGADAVVSGAGGGTFGRIGTAMANGTEAAASMLRPTSAGMTQLGGRPTASESSVTINNTFAAPPEDPMTWTRGVMFEAQAAI